MRHDRWRRPDGWSNRYGQSRGGRANPARVAGPDARLDHRVAERTGRHRGGPRSAGKLAGGGQCLGRPGWLDHARPIAIEACLTGA